MLCSRAAHQLPDWYLSVLIPQAIIFEGVWILQTLVNFEIAGLVWGVDVGCVLSSFQFPTLVLT
jgi:hypothetical protein